MAKEIHCPMRACDALNVLRMFILSFEDQDMRVVFATRMRFSLFV